MAAVAVVSLSGLMMAPSPSPCFSVCTFQYLDRIIGNDFYITSYSITTKYIVTVLRCTPAGKKGKTLFFTLSIEIKASWSYFMMSLAGGVSRRALCNGWSARTR